MEYEAASKCQVSRSWWWKDLEKKLLKIVTTEMMAIEGNWKDCSRRRMANTKKYYKEAANEFLLQRKDINGIHSLM